MFSKIVLKKIFKNMNIPLVSHNFFNISTQFLLLVRAFILIDRNFYIGKTKIIENLTQYLNFYRKILNKNIYIYIYIYIKSNFDKYNE